MPRVTLAAAATGADVVLTTADNIFYVETGTVDFSTDNGTTWVPFTSGEKVVFSAGLTVDNRNSRSDPAAFSHMAI
jgi:hypothetical protein